jgi:hypothetical protein
VLSSGRVIIGSNDSSFHAQERGLDRERFGPYARL